LTRCNEKYVKCTVCDSYLREDFSFRRKSSVLDKLKAKRNRRARDSLNEIFCEKYPFILNRHHVGTNTRIDYMNLKKERNCSMRRKITTDRQHQNRNKARIDSK